MIALYPSFLYGLIVMLLSLNQVDICLCPASASENCLMARCYAPCIMTKSLTGPWVQRPLQGRCTGRVLLYTGLSNLPACNSSSPHTASQQCPPVLPAAWVD